MILYFYMKATTVKNKNISWIPAPEMHFSKTEKVAMN
jgi:hypothetical protein